MAKRFDGKVVVVTGGTTGIGLETARAYIEEGARVIVTGRSAGAAESARKELGSSATVLISDTSKLADLDVLAGEVNSRFGGFDVLFVNAGIAKFAGFDQAAEQLFDEIFDVNVKGAYFAVQKLAPLLKTGGSIVLNTSVLDQKGFAGTSIYSASKAALRSLARTLSAELLPRGIRVNAVAPGPISTPIYDKLGFEGEARSAFEEQTKSTIPMKRFGRSEEVAKAVLFLSSPEASYTTGAELLVDGGAANL